MNLFELKDVCVDFTTANQRMRAVHRVSIHGQTQETVGIVGESGSGKTTLAKALLKLEQCTSGEIFFHNTNILKTSRSEMRKMRRHMQLIFQDPDASLNPRHTAGWHLQEVFTVHFPNLTLQERNIAIESALHTVELENHLQNRYPFELSGGQKQRLLIARTLLLSPQLIVLDEPLSSLDAALRKSVLLLLKKIQQKTNVGYLFITHDLSTLSVIAQRVAVMYRGSIVELASVDELYKNPTHPYTQGLLSCIPIADPILEKKRTSLLFPSTTNPLPIGQGCPFAHRCPVCKDRCFTEEPPRHTLSPSHFISCHYPDQVTRRVL